MLCCDVSYPPPSPPPPSLLQLGPGLTPHLTKLVLGVHEVTWDVSGLAGVAPQLIELDIHNPFLK